MPKRKADKHRPQHEANDFLTVFKADRDIVEDSSVQNELGVLVSEDNKWLITRPQTVTALTYGDPHYGPYSLGLEYVAVSESGEVDDAWVNHRAEAWYKAAGNRELTSQRGGSFGSSVSSWALLIMVVLFVLCFLVAPFVVEPQEAVNAGGGGAPAPTPSYYNAEGTPVPPPTPTALPRPRGRRAPRGRSSAPRKPDVECLPVSVGLAALILREWRGHAGRRQASAYEKTLSAAERRDFRRRMTALHLPDDPEVSVAGDWASIYTAAASLRDYGTPEEVGEYRSRLTPAELKAFREVYLDPNPPPDVSAGYGDWPEIERWSREEPVVTNFMGFPPGKWLAVRNRRAVKRQYDVLTTRLGNGSVWAGKLAYLVCGAGGLLLGLVFALVMSAVAQSGSDEYSINFTATGEAVYSQGGSSWSGWLTLLITLLGGAAGAPAGWMLSLYVMYRRAAGPVYALQLFKEGSRLLRKLKVRLWRLNYADHSEAMGGSSRDGRGGLLGGHVLHITRDDLMALPARAIPDLPTIGGDDDAMEQLIAEGEQAIDGAQNRIDYSNGQTIRQAGEIKILWSKPRLNRLLTPEVAKWGLAALLAILIFFQVQSGFSLGPDSLNFDF